MQEGRNRDNHRQQQQQPSAAAVFRGALVSKVTTICSVISYLYMSQKNISFPLEYAKPKTFVLSKIAFSTPGEAIVGTSLLAILMRKYEREMGSRKFVVFWGFIQCFTIAQEIFCLELLNARNLVYTDTAAPIRISYSGPYALLAAVFYLYHSYGPRIHPRFVSVFGLHFSEKTFYYVWYSQLLLSGGVQALFPTSLGMVASLLYTQSPLRELRVPEWMLQPIRRYMIGPPAAPPQRMPQRRMHRQRPPAAAQPAVQRPPEAEIPVPEPDADAIEQLTNMGFPRQQVMDALRQTHNNVEHAANRLLGGT